MDDYQWPHLVSVTEAARRARVDPSTLAYWGRRGWIKVLRIGRCRRVRWHEVDVVAQQRREARERRAIARKKRSKRGAEYPVRVDGTAGTARSGKAGLGQV